MSVFLIIFTALLAVVHGYLWWRVGRYLFFSRRQKVALAAGLGLMLVLLLATMPMVRLLPRDIASPIAHVFFGWMGVLMFATLTFMLVDAVTWLAARWLQRSGSVPLDQEKRHFFRKAAGLTALANTAGLSGYAVAEGLRPVRVNAFPVTIEKLPRALDGLRIVQITDVHIGPALDGRWLEGVVRQINALRPDLVAITGDLVDGPLERLREHVAPLKHIRAPGGVFFITGNHEYYADVKPWMPYLQSLGLNILRNECVNLRPRGGDSVLQLAGVDDFSGVRVRGHGPDFEKALGKTDASLPLILLAHQPRAIHHAVRYGVDLQLSGHTHGGQIWPWNFMVYLQQPFVEGLHTYPDSHSQVYVSPGTGFWGPPMRLGTAAEISCITLRTIA